MAGATALVTASFNSESFDFIGLLSLPAERPSGVTYALDGTEHFHVANFVARSVCSMSLESDNVVYAAMLGKLTADTTGALVCGRGTATARITSIDSTDVPGNPATGPNSSAVHRLMITVSFQLLTAWS
jgi:hypothetical protein